VEQVQQKPLRIKILQWLFLVITLLIFKGFTFDYVYSGIANGDINRNFNDFYLGLSNFLLVIAFPLLFLAVTICLFLSTKLSIKLITPLLIIIALISFWALQAIFSVVYFNFVGINWLTADDNVTMQPEMVNFIKNNAPLFFFRLAIATTILVYLVYGLPLTLVYIVHRTIKGK
jgi:hypothetical protein